MTDRPHFAHIQPPPPSLKCLLAKKGRGAYIISPWTRVTNWLLQVALADKLTLDSQIANRESLGDFKSQRFDIAERQRNRKQSHPWCFTGFPSRGVHF